MLTILILSLFEYLGNGRSVVSCERQASYHLPLLLQENQPTTSISTPPPSGLPLHALAITTEIIQLSIYHPIQHYFLYPLLLPTLKYFLPNLSCLLSWPKSIHIFTTNYFSRFRIVEKRTSSASFS